MPFVIGLFRKFRNVGRVCGWEGLKYVLLGLRRQLCFQAEGKNFPGALKVRCLPAYVASPTSDCLHSSPSMEQNRLLLCKPKHGELVHGRLAHLGLKH
jgi:hypothetical protein